MQYKIVKLNGTIQIIYQNNYNEWSPKIIEYSVENGANPEVWHLCLQPMVILEKNVIDLSSTEGQNKLKHSWKIYFTIKTKRL